jgi:hypothetical protein
LLEPLVRAPDLVLEADAAGFNAVVPIGPRTIQLDFQLVFQTREVFKQVVDS